MARLCLDCEEVHAAQQCPVCASESFAFLSRWIPTPERRTRPRAGVPDPTVNEERLEAVRGLTTGRVLTGGVVGLTALSVLGWLWQRSGPQKPDATAGGLAVPRAEEAGGTGTAHDGSAESTGSSPGAR